MRAATVAPPSQPGELVPPWTNRTSAVLATAPGGDARTPGWHGRISSRLRRRYPSGRLEVARHSGCRFHVTEGRHIDGPQRAPWLSGGSTCRSGATARPTASARATRAPIAEPTSPKAPGRAPDRVRLYGVPFQNWVRAACRMRSLDRARVRNDRAPRSPGGAGVSALRAAPRHGARPRAAPHQDRARRHAPDRHRWNHWYR
jgi:hypothetical protein